MKMQKVELRIIAVVVADDETDAYEVTEDCWRDILSDADLHNISIAVIREVSRPDDLSDGWNKHCVPYGGDGNANIGDHFAS